MGLLICICISYFSFFITLLIKSEWIQFLLRLIFSLVSIVINISLWISFFLILFRFQNTVLHQFYSLLHSVYIHICTSHSFLFYCLIEIAEILTKTKI